MMMSTDGDDDQLSFRSSLAVVEVKIVLCQSSMAENSKAGIVMMMVVMLKMVKMLKSLTWQGLLSADFPLAVKLPRASGKEF